MNLKLTNSLNEEKTKYTLFHKFRQKDNITLKFPMLAINGKVIERTTSIKLLGILLDEHLSWKKHSSVVENKVSRNRILHKPKSIFSKGSLKTQYFSFVQLLKLWEYCLGKHHSNKAGKTCKQAKRGY